MRKIIKDNLYFLIPYLIFALFSSAILMINSKAEIHLAITSIRNSCFDFFFRYWTHTGHGLFALFITILLLFFKYRWALISAVSNIFIGIVVQMLKRLVFEDSYRPVLWFRTHFENFYELNLVKGAEPGWYYSFPSGHTATAFGVFFLLSIFAKKNTYKLLFFFFALLSGYSRVYLSWHFFGDVLFGSFTGLLISFLTCLIFLPKRVTKLNGSLLKSKKSDK